MVNLNRNINVYWGAGKSNHEAIRKVRLPGTLLRKLVGAKMQLASASVVRAGRETAGHWGGHTSETMRNLSYLNILLRGRWRLGGWRFEAESW
jgi:hypothetical protein